MELHTSMVLYLFYSIFAFVSTVLFIKFLRLHYQKLKLVDTPNERSSHTTATPRVGGIGIFVPFFLLYLIIVFTDGQRKPPVLFSLTFLMFLIGLWDDMKVIRASLKFVLELIIIITGLFVSFQSADVFIVIIVAVFIMWIMNSFNFMDGIDGFAALHALPIFIAYGIITQNIAFLIISCSLLGFLLFNFSPAKIFLGDAGSLPLGFLIGMSPFVFFANDLNWTNSYNILLVVCFVILCDITFFFDAALTLTRRTLRRMNIFQAHRDHIYQKTFDAGMSARTISLYNFALTIIASSYAVYLFVFAKTTNKLLQNYFFASLAIVALYSLLLVATYIARNKRGGKC